MLARKSLIEFIGLKLAQLKACVATRRGSRTDGARSKSAGLDVGIRGDQQFVLKVALTEDDNRRLHDEAKALGAIQSEFIVGIHEELELAGRTVLVLQKAGDETLASLLRKEGVPALFFLWLA